MIPFSRNYFKIPITTLTGNEITSRCRLVSAPELDELPQKIRLPSAPENYPTINQLIPLTPESFDEYLKKARKSSLECLLRESVAQLKQDRERASMRDALAKEIQASFSMQRDSLRADMGESLVAMKKEIQSEVKTDISAIQPDIKEMKAEVAQTRKEMKTKPPPRHKLDLLLPSLMTRDAQYESTVFRKQSRVRSTALRNQ